MDVHQIHTIPNQPTKMDVLPKTFVQIILAANWLVRHSSPSPKQQGRPLPSLLSLSFFYGWGYRIKNLFDSDFCQIRIKKKFLPQFRYGIGSWIRPHILCLHFIKLFAEGHRILDPEVSLIVPDFKITVYSSSCNYLFFRPSLAFNPALGMLLKKKEIAKEQE